MADIAPRVMRGVLLLGLAGVVVAALSSCKTMNATDRQSRGEPVALRKTQDGEWPRLVASTEIGGYLPDAEGDVAATYGTEFPAANWQAMQSVRDDLRRSLLDVAEGQIARRSAGMSDGAEARLEARRNELAEANSREYAVLSEKASGDSAARIREIETQLQGPRLNLKLKLAALKSRVGLFEGKLDKDAASRSDWLKAEMERLDLKQAQSVQDVRDSESIQMSELKARQRSLLESEIERMRRDYGDQTAEQAKAQRNRLTADLAEEAFSESVYRSPGVCPDSGVTICRALNDLNSRAAGTAERKFSRDLAAARASMKSRQSQIRQREADDYALTSDK